MMLAKAFYTCPGKAYGILVFRKAGINASLLIEQKRMTGCTTKGSNPTLTDTLTPRLQGIVDVVHASESCRLANVIHGGFILDNLFVNMDFCTWGFCCPMTELNEKMGDACRFYHTYMPWYPKDYPSPEVPKSVRKD
jgi:hypothetical protein